MPKRRAYRASNAPLGPAAIGAALKLRWRDIDWRDIDIAFDRWQSACQSIYSPILLREEAGSISHQEKLRRVFERDKWLGEGVSSLGLLVVLLRREGGDEFMPELWRQSGVSEEKIQKELARRGKLPDRTRGLDLKTVVEQCTTSLKEPTTNHITQDIAALGSHFLNTVLEELRRLKILGICEYCEGTFYPTTPRKEVCSMGYEGRNCSARRRAKRSYEKSRGQTR